MSRHAPLSHAPPERLPTMSSLTAISPSTIGDISNQQDLHPEKSYLSAVQNKKNSIKTQVRCLVNGNQTIQVPADIFKDVAPLWEDFLIGKYLSTTAPHVAKIILLLTNLVTW